jgi:hypothetical protein
MDNLKTNLELFPLITSIYDIESNILTYAKGKFQNFLLSINKLFSANNWYNNNILPYIKFILSKKLFPLIISSILFIKSKFFSVKFISEDFLNIHIQNKNKLIIFILLNSFESLIIKYIDTFFNFCYGFFFNKINIEERIKYYGKCVKYIFKHLKNIQNVIIGMNFYKYLAPEENKNIFNGIEKPIKLVGYGYIIKNIYDIFWNIKDIYRIYHLKETIKNKSKNNENINNQIVEISNIKEEGDEQGYENICILCLNKYKDVCCTPCGHLFCWTCIHLYLMEKNYCPKCKKKVKPQEILFLQNY